MSDALDLPATACLDCGAQLGAKFCGSCGQKHETPTRALRELVLDFLSHPLLDTKLWRTLVRLLFRPGALTEDYVQGRRTRYFRPLKLYLTISVTFFAILALTSRGPRWITFSDDPPAATKRLHLPIRRIDERFQQKRDALDGPTRPEAIRSIQATMSSAVPKMVFFLLPLSAVLLKLAWRRRFFVEHLVFTLHLHSFAFAAALLLLLRTPLANAAFVLWAIVYGVVAFKRVYREGWGWTLAKLAGLGTVYAFVFAVAIGVTAFVSFLAS